ncbi:MAG: hypothetical protein WCC04_12555 [Terriglobales bacterium]
MPARRHEPEVVTASTAVNLRRVSSWRGIRVLAWDRDALFGCRGYQLVCLQTVQLPQAESAAWEPVARFRPVWWRKLTARSRLGYRLVRDGFHALAVLDDKTMIAAVAGAIVTRPPQSDEFRVTHKILWGTRPLHIAAVPSGYIYWGEYFDNRDRKEVHIYASADQGQTWHVAHTFPAGAIRHVHNIVYDRWGDCVWILTGDEGTECKVLRADRDLRSVETVLSGNQQARAVAAVPCEDALYLSTDTPFEQNHVLRLDRTGPIERIADLASSSIFGCRSANALFFSTMAEPSPVNSTDEVCIAGSGDMTSWHTLVRWKKDALPMRYFQYGNAILPGGENTTNYLAATTIAVNDEDLVTTLWEVGTKENRKANASSSANAATARFTS